MQVGWRVERRLQVQKPALPQLVRGLREQARTPGVPLQEQGQGQERQRSMQQGRQVEGSVWAGITRINKVILLQLKMWLTFPTIRTKKSFSLMSQDSIVFESGNTLPECKFKRGSTMKILRNAPEKMIF
jgi:hypothetical protein